jgi:hypothetical protein
MKLPYFLALSGAVLFAWNVPITPALGHPGGLNAEGCHNNRKTGGYHCHRGPSATPSSALRAVSTSSRREFANCAQARAAGAAPVRIGDPGRGVRMIKRLPVALFTLMFSACGSSDQRGANSDAGGAATSVSSNEGRASAVADAPNADRVPIKIHTLAGGPGQVAYLVDRLNRTTPESVENAVHESGYLCSSITGFYQLEQKGEMMDIYKIDCAEGSFQLTAINGSTYFKPWTGNIFGSTG